jgi:hypothetical protein
MRTLLMLGLLALPLAASSDDRTSTREESREAAQAAGDDMKKAGQDAKESAREAGRETHQEMKDAGSTGSATMRDETRSSRANADSRKQGPFADADNFEVKGKLHKMSKSSITIRRDEDKLPPAKLNVDRQTRIEVDGEQATWAQLKQGADVKASFNLRDDKPMAVEIKAEKTDAQEQGEERMEERQDQMKERREEQTERRQ